MSSEYKTEIILVTSVKLDAGDCPPTGCTPNVACNPNTNCTHLIVRLHWGLVDQIALLQQAYAVSVTRLSRMDHVFRLKNHFKK